MPIGVMPGMSSIALLLIPIGAAMAATEGSATAFDLAQLEREAPTIAAPGRVRKRSRYLPPRLHAIDGERDDGVQIRLRGRKVRVRVPL